MKTKTLTIEDGKLIVPLGAKKVMAITASGDRCAPKRWPWPGVGNNEAVFDNQTGFPAVVCVMRADSTIPQRKFAWAVRLSADSDEYSVMEYDPCALPVELVDAPPPIALPAWLRHLGGVARVGFPFQKPSELAFD